MIHTPKKNRLVRDMRNGALFTHMNNGKLVRHLNPEVLKGIPPVSQCGLKGPADLQEHYSCAERGNCDVCSLCDDHCLGHFKLREAITTANYSIKVKA